MFSAKQLVDGLHPYERSVLIDYIARPYVLKIGVEVGINFTESGRLKFSLAELLNLVIAQVRAFHREQERLQGQVKNQKREIERQAQLVFQFLEKHETNTD